MEKKIARKHQRGALKAINSKNEGIIQLPTGTGKTFIQALSINDNIKKSIDWVNENMGESETPVFVILAPRIILCDQLYSEIRGMLSEKNQDCQYLIVNSGRTEDKDIWGEDLPYRELNSTTSSKDIIRSYDKARSEKVPLIIFSTYHSAERISDSGIPIYMALCDEAHYLVSEEFGWIAEEDEAWKKEKFDSAEINATTIKQFNSHRKYYFTATLKETASDKGLGMNNSELFGPIIYSKTPLEMITAGEVIRPRIHMVNIETRDEFTREEDMDANAIADSFIEHRIHCQIGAKMLVVTKGSKHLNKVVNHPRIQNLLRTRKFLNIFDISSEHKPRINGKVVDRRDFLTRLQGLDDRDEAIIFHINILTEGIDIPGITGIMPMTTLKLSRFLQTLGRSTRLYGDDRKNLYDNIIKPSQTNEFIKPYAWIMIPVYDFIGNDLKDSIFDIIYALRSFGFDASEDVVIKQKRGSAIPVPLEGINEKDKSEKALSNILLKVTHEIETVESANQLRIDEYQMDLALKNKTDEELIKFFETC